MIVIVDDKAFNSKIETITILFDDDDEYHNCMMQMLQYAKIHTGPKEEVLNE